jgi:Uma2 family endonuclease
MSLDQPLPSGRELPDTDGEPLDSEWVSDQTRIYLIEPLRHYLGRERMVAFVGGNSFVYYAAGAQPLGPDFYVVRGAPQRDQTRWVAAAEGGLLPSTVIEFLSPSTESRDRGEKFVIYRDLFKTEDYFLVDPESLYVEGYRLQRGHYVAAAPGPDGWFYVGSLKLSLGVHGPWLRLRTEGGEILTTGREEAEQERQRAEQERQRAEQERQRADAAEQELRRLREQLGGPQGQSGAVDS